MYRIQNLSFHSERIAVGYVLISTSSGTTLIITKNLRACVSCYSAIILILKLVERDGNRFHNFKDGLCSCGPRLLVRRINGSTS